MENVLIKFKEKAKKQNIIKAGLCSVAISLLFNAPFLIAFWILNYKYKFLICLGIFIITFSILFPILYFKKFKYSETALARKIDELGLEERVLTMIELKDDDSFIAKKQKEDTEKSLKEININNFRCGFKKQSVFSIFATAFVSLIISLSLMFPNIKETIIAHGEQKYTIKVSVEGHGFVIDYSKYENQSLINAIDEKQKNDDIEKINGREAEELKQLPISFSSRVSVDYKYLEEYDATMVLDGANFDNIFYEIRSDESHILMALPYKGYVFVGWSDGYVSPFREIDDYSKSLVALFDEVDSLDDEDKDSTEGDEAGDSDSGSGNSNSGNNNGGGSDSDIIDGNTNGAKESKANQVINGETYYGDIFNQSYQEALERLKNDSSLTEEQKKAISDYFESIRKN